jgi:enoyl-CoA hydratase
MIMQNSSNALAKALMAIEAGYQSQQDGYQAEVNLFGECFAHPEFQEGTQAFLTKRKANF